MKFSARAERCLTGVHPDLVRVVRAAASLANGALEFTVTEGPRTLVRQTELVKIGASTTMRSRHVPEKNACRMACAVDLAALIAGEVRWDWPLYHQLAALMKAAATAESVPIEWGGDWPNFPDGPHFQLPWGSYP
jgi:peptidoglycan LD-endopeptidase CwlK